MIINAQNLQTMSIGYNTTFTGAFSAVETNYKKISMEAPSQGSEQAYTWLGAFAKLREWVGDRHIRNLVLHDYTIKNKKFEDTISIPREKIEDDAYGVFAPVIAEMGRNAALHPDQVIFELLSSGFTTICYDGQPFFDADHPADPFGEAEDQGGSLSNLQTGSGPAWFLIDASRAIKPFIWQERLPYKFTALNSETDENVFMRDEFLYGVRARANAGFGLWQLAYASKDALTVANYEAARAAMRGLVGENKKPLGVKPTHLVVPTSLEGDALRIVNSGLRTTGGDTPIAITNEWAGTAELIVSEYLPNE